MNTFEKLYKLIASPKNFIEPLSSSRLDIYAFDRYEMGEYFAGMGDDGYSKWVGIKNPDGKLNWRVDYYYATNRLLYIGISEEEFNNLILPLMEWK